LKPLPIRLRLSLWYFAVFSCAGIVLCFATWFLLQRSLKTVASYEMGERIDDVRNILLAQPANASLDTLRKQFSEYNARDDGKWLQVIDQDGNWLFRSDRIRSNEPTLPLPQHLPNHDEITSFEYSTHRRAHHLAFALARSMVVHGRAYAVQTGLSQSTSLVLLRMFARDLLLLTPGLLLLAAILGYWMSRKALSPIADLAQRARQISTESLDVRLPTSNTRDEVHHLSETLNKMLDRIESGVRSIQDFTANAAHELRTPIALIRSEVEVALFLPRSNNEYRESCTNVQRETVRMTGLIESLLMLARTDAGVEALRFEVVDISQLVRQVGNKWHAPMSRTDLEFRTEISDSPMAAICDPLSIRRYWIFCWRMPDDTPMQEARLHCGQHWNTTAFFWKFATPGSGFRKNACHGSLSVFTAWIKYAHANWVAQDWDSPSQNGSRSKTRQASRSRATSVWGPVLP
jgi:signal transduction histidine kinase